jgi:DNA-directed RNA polymerase specialized sigma24 family protein
MVDARADQTAKEQTLHKRLVAGDPLATIDAFDHLAVRLSRRLAAKFPTTDPDLVEQAVSDTLLDYFRRPARYDPSKRSLGGYLFMAAERDLLNLRQRDQRRRGPLRSPDPVELDAWAREAGLVHRHSIGLHYNPLTR